MSKDKSMKELCKILYSACELGGFSVDEFMQCVGDKVDKDVCENCKENKPSLTLRLSHTNDIYYWCKECYDENKQLNFDIVI